MKNASKISNHATRIRVQSALLLLFSLFFGNVSGAVFVVTSNADSGAGTLREALTLAAANGSAEIDQIRFNLPGLTPADHTIKINSDLPVITTDVIIDASTQPGQNASVNGAKVIIDGSQFTLRPFQIQSVFRILDVEHFEFYSIIIKNFDLAGIRIGGLYFFGSNGYIKIGEPGKGNVIYGVYGITSQNLVSARDGEIEEFIMTNNFIGVKENGIDIPHNFECGVSLKRVHKGIIGGQGQTEGNLIFGIFNISYGDFPGSRGGAFSLAVKNNFFTANINEERPGLTIARNSIYNGLSGENFTHTGPFNVEVSDNVFGSSFGMSGITNVNAIIQRNYFGTSRDQSKPLPINNNAMGFRFLTGHVLVGGPTVQEGNVITNANSNPVYVTELFAVTAEEAKNIELSHNSFYCNPGIPFLYVYTGPFAKPLEVLLKEKTPSYVAGTTAPGARVELFYTDPECTNCQPERYFATVTADNAGNWKYPGAIESGVSVMASATLNQLSSEFSDPRIYVYRSAEPILKITNQTCDDKLGKIEGVFTVNVDKVEWRNEAGQIMGTNAGSVSNLPAGRYRLKGNQFGCIVFSEWITVENQVPQLAFTGLPNIVHASCGNGGSILNLFPNNYTELTWLDKNGTVAGNERELTDVPPGEYKLKLTGLEGSGCIKEFGPYIINNVNGPNIDVSGMKKTNATCLTAGSIKDLNVTGTGTIIYKWIDANGSEMGHTKDISNLPEGSYRLLVKDESSCGTIESAVFKIETDNKIELNDQNANSTNTACNASTGTVTGITFTGAGQFKWLNERNETVGNSSELTGVPEGTYHLVFSNNSGCKKESRPFTIETAITAYPGYQITTSPANCDEFNGSISIDFGSGIGPDQIRVADENNLPAGNTASTPNLKPGNYAIYFTMDGECETLYRQVNVGLVPKLTIHYEGLSVNKDNCMQGKGSINGIGISGGTPPYIYKWQESNTGLTFSSPELNNVYAGQYRLTVKDQNDCEAVTGIIDIANTGSFIAPPQTDPVTACPGTEVIIRVRDAHMNSGVYNLYKGSAITPVASNVMGSFKIITDLVSNYVLSYKIGECESEKVPLKLILGEPNIQIPNTFSPNGDGINDSWQIQELSKYTGISVTIFNRNGQKIFSSTGYDKPFDGRWQGTDLPIGTYYYVIDLKGSCSSLKGGVTIIR